MPVFSPDRTRVVASDEKVVRIFDAETGDVLATSEGHVDRVHSTAFSPDGTRVATASLDGTARIFDAATGRTLLIIQAHREGVAYAAFSPDGTRLVTTSWDKSARVWNVAPDVRPVKILRDLVRSSVPIRLSELGVVVPRSLLEVPK